VQAFKFLDTELVLSSGSLLSRGHEAATSLVVAPFLVPASLDRLLLTDHLLHFCAPEHVQACGLITATATSKPVRDSGSRIATTHHSPMRTRMSCLDHGQDVEATRV
jgi:hypothetical protein